MNPTSTPAFPRKKIIIDAQFILDCKDTHDLPIESLQSSIGRTSGLDRPPDLEVTDITWTAGSHPRMTEILLKYPFTRHLDLSNNDLTTLSFLLLPNGEPVLPFLVYVRCSGNKLKTLCLQNLFWLTYVDCSDCILESLAYIEGSRLVKLLCSGNHITDYSPIMSMSKLVCFERDIRPHILAGQHITVQEVIHNLESGCVTSIARRSNSLLNDTRTTSDLDYALAMLVASAPATLIAFKDADTHTFNPRAFLIISNLCKDARVHSTLGLTFADLMDYIWTLMATSDQLTELISVFSQHMEHPVYMSIENLFRHAIIPFCYPKSELSPNRLTHSPLYTLDQAVRSSSTDSDNTASLCISAFKAAFYYRTGLANAAAASDHARICYTTDPDLFFMYENEGPPIEYYTTNRFAEI